MSDSAESKTFKDRVQLFNPMTGRYVKIDTENGRIIAQKKKQGPFAHVREVHARTKSA